MRPRPQQTSFKPTTLSVKPSSFELVEALPGPLALLAMPAVATPTGRLINFGSRPRTLYYGLPHQRSILEIITTSSPGWMICRIITTFLHITVLPPLQQVTRRTLETYLRRPLGQPLLLVG